MNDALMEHDTTTQLAVNQLLHEACHARASDIHLEPLRDYCRIRFRIDGLLREHAALPHWQGTRMITRIKYLAELNIAEKRLPQDGRLHHVLSQTQHLSIRISTAPHHLGEKLAMRLFKPHQKPLLLNECGLLPDQYQLMQTALAQPSGLILITGPTGSGKTTTLYAAINALNTITKNIITIEDPIEIEIEGITQINIHPRIGLSFATALRHVLRQDPDILLIGEIRDAETACIAMQAAQTGHLVLASLHTTNTLTALTRLSSLGLDASALNTHLSLILSQRLVRQPCTHCQGLSSPCAYCWQGYHGQTGVFECLSLSPSAQPSLTFAQACAEKCRLGVTTAAECQRVLGNAYAQV